MSERNPFDLPIASERIMTDGDRAFFDKAEADAAEVERLRAECDGLRQLHTEAWERVRREEAHTVKVEAENAELRGLVERLRLSQFRIAAMAEALETERDQLKARLAWFEGRQHFFDKLTETVDRNPSNPSYLHAILEGLRLWDAEHPKPE